MLCKEIINGIECTYPKQAASEWDNVGLLVGRTEKEVKQIYVAVDVTDQVIDAAIEVGADMLITHHPLIFSPLKKITDEHFIENRVVKLLQHDISYYAMHTNYDAIRMGRLSGEMIGLCGKEILEVTDVEKNAGVGCVGELEKEMTLEACCDLVKTTFHLSAVRLYGDKNAKVKRVAISPGSGKHMSELAIEKGAEVFITGDISHHEGIDAVSRGLAIIDAGHYGLEQIFIGDMAEFLTRNFKTLEVKKADIVHPFQTI